jgi:arginyl-tRNA synthetase
VQLGPDNMAGESTYNHLLDETVAELEEKGIAREDQGALVVSPEGFTGREGQPAVLIVRKTVGGYTYAATDLAAVRYRFQTLEATDALYVVGTPQSMHFAMVFAVAREAGWIPDGIGGPVHVPFGSVLGEDGKMLRTRSGDPIRLFDLVQEAIERAGALVEERSPENASPEVARAVGVGSLKYADLVNDRERDYTFAWDRMLALDGNTGVYLQYAVARLRSMLERGGVESGSSPEIAAGTLFSHPAERALALRLVGLPTALERAVEASKPHVLARYLYEVSTTFSTFYEQCPVLKAEGDVRALRLLLSAATERTLVTGLDMLGIETPRRL